MIAPHSYAAMAAHQAELIKLEKERRADLEAATDIDVMSPVAPLSPRAREAFVNIGIIDG